MKYQVLVMGMLTLFSFVDSAFAINRECHQWTTMAQEIQQTFCSRIGNKSVLDNCVDTVARRHKGYLGRDRLVEFLGKCAEPETSVKYESFAGRECSSREAATVQRYIEDNKEVLKTGCANVGGALATNGNRSHFYKVWSQCRFEYNNPAEFERTVFQMTINERIGSQSEGLKSVECRSIKVPVELAEAMSDELLDQIPGEYFAQVPNEIPDQQPSELPAQSSAPEARVESGIE